MLSKHEINFHYHKTAKRRGIEGMLITTVFIFLMVGGAFYMVFVKKEPEFLDFLNHFVAWILGGVILMLYWVNYRLYKSTDSWDIMVTNTEVIWNTPQKAPSEKSFQIKLSEIEKVVCKVDYSSDMSNSYCLYLINGGEVDLNYMLSGLNIKKFIKGLEKSGVKYQYEKTNE